MGRLVVNIEPLDERFCHTSMAAVPASAQEGFLKMVSLGFPENDFVTMATAVGFLRPVARVQGWQYF
jgi:hypothetical protein